MSENNNFDNEENTGDGDDNRYHEDDQNQQDNQEGSQLSYFNEDTVADSDNVGIVESEDYNYVAEEQQKKKRRFKLVVVIIVFTLLAALIGGYYGFQQVVERSNTPDEASEPSGPQAPEPERLPEGEEEVEIEEGENPMTEVFNGDPAPYEDTEIVEVGNDRFVFSGSQVMLEAEDATLVETAGVECELSQGSEICYAGYIDFEDLDPLSVYASKNIAENRMLETMTETNTQSVTGASGAIMGMLSTEELSSPAIAVAAENGAGFLLMFENGAERGVGDFSGYTPLLTVHD